MSGAKPGVGLRSKSAVVPDAGPFTGKAPVARGNIVTVPRELAPCSLPSGFPIGSRAGEPSGLWQLMAVAQEEVLRKEVRIVTSLPAPENIKIDGILNEKWPIRTSVKLNRPAIVTPIQGPAHWVPIWDGPEDLSATFFNFIFYFTD